MFSDVMRMKSRGHPIVDMIKTSVSQPVGVGVPDSRKPDSDYEAVRDLRLKLQHSQEENQKLQAVITDLTQVNKRWQKYNTDRQIYVQKLLVTIQDQQEQLNLIGERSFPSPSPSTRSDLPPPTTASEPSQSASSFKGTSEHEIERLRSNEQKLKEKVSILEFQVKAHRDDWEAELNEKKQALKDKEIAERKLSELLSEGHLLSRGAEYREMDGQTESHCRHCGRAFDSDYSPPPRSRLYRSAVTLPPSRHSSTASVSTTGDDTGFESRASKSEADRWERWNIRPDEPSYSRCSTAPLLGASSNSGGPATVRSFVQIPIAKSSSVPEGSSAKNGDSEADASGVKITSLDSLKFSSTGPPVTTISSPGQFDGTETLSGESVICLRCGEVFPPNMHLKFLDHFSECQLKNGKHSTAISPKD